jgi:hypothetical protein
MKNQLRRQLLKMIALFTVLCSSTLVLMAQDCDPATNPDCGGDPGGGPGVPLTGADILLLAMGIAFVFYRVWKHNRATKAATT